MEEDMRMRSSWPLGAAILLAALLLAVSCGGVAQSEYDAVKQQLTTREQEVASLNQQVGELEQRAQEAEQAQLEWPGKPASIPILGGIPNAPPRPTPTPLPPGVTAPPPPEPPAASTVPLYAYIDTVTAGPGESKYQVDANLSCVKTSTFSRGMRIVWRMEVVDTSSGRILQAADVETAILKLANGDEVNFRYSRHGRTEDAPWFWTAAWDVPSDHPLGVLEWTIEVGTKDGKRSTFGDPLIVAVPDFVDTRTTIVPEVIQ